MTEFLGVKIPLNPWVGLPLIVLSTSVLAYLINIVVLQLIKRAVQRTPTEIDDRIYQLSSPIHRRRSARETLDGF